MGPVLLGILVALLISGILFSIIFREGITDLYKEFREMHLARQQRVIYALKYPPLREWRIEIKRTGISSNEYIVQFRTLSKSNAEWENGKAYISERQARRRIKYLKLGDLNKQISEDNSSTKYISV